MARADQDTVVSADPFVNQLMQRQQAQQATDPGRVSTQPVGTPTLANPVPTGSSAFTEPSSAQEYLALHLGMPIGNYGGYNYDTAMPQTIETAQNLASAANTRYGLQTGSEAVFYDPSKHGGVATIGLPGGYFSQKPDGTWEWTPRTAGAGGGGGAAGGSGAVTGGGGVFNFSPSTAARDPRADELYNYLLGRAKQSLVVDPNDPTIKAQTDAYAAKAMNQWRNTASAIAERGGANFNPDATNRSIGEQLAQGTAEFQGNLMMQEMQSRRADIQQALTEAAGLLTAEQQIALQDELTKLDEQMKLYGLNLGESDFMKSLQQRAFEFDTNRTDMLNK